MFRLTRFFKRFHSKCNPLKSYENEECPTTGGLHRFPCRMRLWMHLNAPSEERAVLYKYRASKKKDKVF